MMYIQIQLSVVLQLELATTEYHVKWVTCFVTFWISDKQLSLTTQKVYFRIHFLKIWASGIHHNCYYTRKIFDLKFKLDLSIAGCIRVLTQTHRRELQRYVYKITAQTVDGSIWNMEISSKLFFPESFTIYVYKSTCIDRKRPPWVGQ